MACMQVRECKYERGDVVVLIDKHEMWQLSTPPQQCKCKALLGSDRLSGHYGDAVSGDSVPLGHVVGAVHQLRCGDIHPSGTAIDEWYANKQVVHSCMAVDDVQLHDHTAVVQWVTLAEAEVQRSGHDAQGGCSGAVAGVQGDGAG